MAIVNFEVQPHKEEDFKMCYDENAEAINELCMSMDKERRGKVYCMLLHGEWDESLLGKFNGFLFAYVLSKYIQFQNPYEIDKFYACHNPYKKENQSEEDFNLIIIKQFYTGRVLNENEKYVGIFIEHMVNAAQKARPEYLKIVK